MQTELTSLEGVLAMRPRRFSDERGFFLESWNQRKFDDAVGRSITFVQDNHSRSIQGVLRGLHFQKDPFAQGKLVSVTRGKIFDVVVDLREKSPTLGKWFGMELCCEDRVHLWIPAGFAHGFLTLSETADVLYKTTEYYSPDHECCIRWDDSSLSIEWPSLASAPILSPKDADGKTFSEALSL